MYNIKTSKIMRKLKEEMKQFTSIKNVKAAPCDLFDAQEIIGRKIYGGDSENMMGYLIQYEDGYMSWSPKRAFEEGYVLTETFIDRMKFELAELNKRISKAMQACFTPGTLHWYDRRGLMEQLEVMQKYANIIYERIEKAETEQTKEEIKEERCCPTPPLARGEK